MKRIVAAAIASMGLLAGPGWSHGGTLETDNLTVNNKITLTTNATFDVSSNTAGRWRMNDNTNTTTVVDASANNNTGVFYGGGNTVDHHTSGKVGTGALFFDGTNDYIDVADSNSLDFGTGSFSIALWIYMDQLKTQDLLCKNTTAEAGLPEFETRVGADGKVAMYTHYYGYSEIYSVTSLTTNRWYHIVMVRNANGVNEIWIDGNLDATATLTVRNVSNTRFMRIGDENRTGGAQFDGQMDEILIVNKVLTSADIRGLYNAGSGSESSTGAVPSAVVCGEARFIDGVGYSKALGDLSMGIYTNSP